ncbi:MAG: protocatechuate dioxygenase [Actinobacteria bacterium]|nr:MAG: protocatechuate dioxygenase [Actinomycetota bacterium]
MPLQPIHRRRALGLLGAAGAGVVLAACGGSKDDASSSTVVPSKATSTDVGRTTGTTGTTGAVRPDMFDDAARCTVTPVAIEGPYYIDVDKIRSDIREDREGRKLRVAARILASDGCTPVRDAVFEIWHCDAAGLYSGFEAASTGGGGGPGGPQGGRATTTDAKRYLRGAQVTNADGIAEITTIYPGWYRGRTVHIHAKVFISSREVLTTQLYFDDALNGTVFASAPYTAHPGRDTFNDDDSIFSDQTILTVSKDGDGYLGLIGMGVKS